MASERTRLHQKEEDDPPPGCCCHILCSCIPQRFMMSILLFVVSVIYSTCFPILGIAILAMTSSVSPTNNQTEAVEESFHWDARTQTLVLSSFSWLLWLSPIPGAYLCRILSGKIVIGLGTLLIGVLNLLSPTVAMFDAGLFIALRVVLGFITSITGTAVVHAIGNWSLRSEKTVMAASFQIGCLGGTFIIYLISATAVYFLDWKWIFWMTGIIGVCFALIWFIFAVESPFTSPTISKTELELFLINQEKLNDQAGVYAESVPWRKMFTSLPVWAIVFAHFVFMFVLGTIANDIPRYLHHIAKISILNVAILQCFGQGIAFLISLPLSVGSDWLIAYYKDMTLVRILTRKVLLCGCYILLTMTLVTMALTKYITSVLIVLAMIVHMTPGLGYVSNVLDIGPQYAGITKGIVNTIGFTGFLLSPLVTEMILKDVNSANQFNIIMFISASISLFGAIFYAVFARSDIQDWAANKENDYDMKQQ